MLKPLIVLLFTFVISFHDFHVTHTTLHYNSSEEKIEITIKVAIEDLELVLQDKGVENLRIGSDNENNLVEQLISDYFKQRLLISPNNNTLSYKWVGKELSVDLHNIYLYFEAVNCNKNGEITSILVENIIFTAILPDQANIVLVEFGDDYHNLTFSKSQKSLMVVLSH